MSRHNLSDKFFEMEELTMFPEPEVPEEEEEEKEIPKENNLAKRHPKRTRNRKKTGDG